MLLRTGGENRGGGVHENRGLGCAYGVSEDSTHGRVPGESRRDREIVWQCVEFDDGTVDVDGPPLLVCPHDRLGDDSE